MAERLRKINRRCWWCGARKGWARFELLFGLCRRCRPYGQDAGIYLLSGPPPWPRNSRAEDHHPARLVKQPDRPPRAAWIVRLLCEHCFHVSIKSPGSWCCECGQPAQGLPVSSCKVCDVIA